MQKQFYKNSLVSIVMNCHNGEHFLNSAIQSILNQTYSNWELIFWDNQSTDNSKNIISSFKDRRIRYYYSQEFTKLGEARNLAIIKCKGEFICFLDTDDIWLKDNIENLINVFYKINDINFAYNGTIVLDQRKNKRLIYPLRDYDKVPSGNIFNYTALNRHISFGGIMIRKSALLKVIPVPKFLSHSVDDYIILNILLDSIAIYTRNLTFIYRIHNNNLTHKQLLTASKEAISIIKILQKVKPDYDFSKIKEDRYYKLSIYYILKGDFLSFINTFLQCRPLIFCYLLVKTVVRRILRILHFNKISKSDILKIESLIE